MILDHEHYTTHTPHITTGIVIVCVGVGLTLSCKSNSHLGLAAVTLSKLLHPYYSSTPCYKIARDLASAGIAKFGGGALVPSIVPKSLVGVGFV